MDNMHAYPGRTMGQLYHRFFRVNDLADGRLDARPTARSTSPTCACPVLAVAGDERRARAAARRCTTSRALLPNAPEVRLETAPRRPPRRAHRPRRGGARRGVRSTSSWPTTAVDEPAHTPLPRGRLSADGGYPGAMPTRRSRRSPVPPCAALAPGRGAGPRRRPGPAAPAPAPVPTAPAGVTAGGVDLSGLTVDQAIAKLDAELRPRVKRVVASASPASRSTLTAEAGASSRLDTVTTAKRAVARAAPGTTAVAGRSSATAARRSGPGSGTIAGRASGSPPATRRSASAAQLRLRTGALGPAPGRRGDARRPSTPRWPTRPAAPASLRTKLVTVRPAVDARTARRRYATVITVDKAHFKLRLFKHFKVAKRYGVAVGQPAYPTPSGLFSIANKQVDPTWSVPEQPVGGRAAGHDRRGRLRRATRSRRAGWASPTASASTAPGEDYSIGTRASHGCIRMHVCDVIDLYPRVPVGTPVLLG